MGFDVDYDELWIVTSQNRVQSNCDVMAFSNSQYFIKIKFPSYLTIKIT